jgi:hypothetical protein
MPPTLWGHKKISFLLKILHICSYIFWDHYVFANTICHVWRDVFDFHQLPTNYRRKNDTTYIDILNRTRLGKLNCMDINVLNTKETSNSAISQIFKRIYQLKKIMLGIQRPTNTTNYTWHTCNPITLHVWWWLCSCLLSWDWFQSPVVKEDWNRQRIRPLDTGSSGLIKGTQVPLKYLVLHEFPLIILT